MFISPHPHHQWVFSKNRFAILAGKTSSYLVLNCFFFSCTRGETWHCPFELWEEESEGDRRVWGEGPLSCCPLTIAHLLSLGAVHRNPCGFGWSLQQRGCSCLDFLCLCPIVHLSLISWRSPQAWIIRTRVSTSGSVPGESTQDVILIRMRLVRLKPQ